MKKVFSFLVFFGITFIIAQKVPGGSSSPCIVGPDNLALNQTGIYSVSSALAQCTQCHDWDIDNLNVNVSGNAQITTDDRLNSVSIKRVGTGSITISITYFTETGCHSCSKTLASIGGGQVSCDATIISNHSSPYSNVLHPELNVYIDVYVGYQNPFPNNASVSIQYNPQPSGFCHVNCVPIIVAPFFQSAMSYQFSIPVGSDGLNLGFYVPITVLYTDLVTGQTCSKILNPYFKPQTHPYRMINISPNPAKSTINIESENLENLNISFYDTFGSVVIKNNKLEKTISIENLKPGIYLYKIKEKDNVIQEGKIIKE